MYLQITERCNMKCRHCCMSATKKGRDMSLDTVRAALQHSDGYITIGGGEPTLHPDIYQIVCLCIGATEEGGTHIITNGKEKEVALTLAKMAKGGAIGAELSLDEYHEKVSPEVVQAYMKPKRPGWQHIPTDHDLRGTRTVTRILARGRGKKIKGAEDECACPEIFVDPAGDVYLCGCRTMKIGDVFNGYETPEDYESGECAADLMRRRECGEYDPNTQHQSEPMDLEAITETADGIRL